MAYNVAYLVDGQSYQKGNNTVANVTAIYDFNKEWEANADVRYKYFPSKEEFTEEELEEIINGGSKTNGDNE